MSGTTRVDSFARLLSKLMNGGCVSDYAIQALDASTWDGFAQLAEKHSGMEFGGCWCTCFHSRVELYRLPTNDDRNVTTLAPDELILELDVPAPDASTYLKAMDRRKWAFPLVGVAAARNGETTSIALAGVAPIPWRLEDVDALEDASPLPGTAYKVEIARALSRRALAAVRA
jgi:hypothetical protein